MRDAQSLDYSLDDRFWDIKALYRDELAENPRLGQGELKAVITIEPNGVVSNVRLESSEITAQRFLNRVRDLMLRWRFESGDYTRAVVQKTFDLRP